MTFWFNNDQESYHETDLTVEAEIDVIRSPDNTDYQITLARDLEDLASLQLFASPILLNPANIQQSGNGALGKLKLSTELVLMNPIGQETTLRVFRDVATGASMNPLAHVNDPNIAKKQATTDGFAQQAGPAFGKTPPIPTSGYLDDGGQRRYYAGAV